jgi:hypothetical protein
MNESSVEGRRVGRIPILLLKTKSTPHDGYEEHFSVDGKDVRRSYEPAFVPVLEHRFQEEALGTVRGLLEKKQISKSGGARYGGLIFTSQRAVEAFAKVVEEGTSTSCHCHCSIEASLLTLAPRKERSRNYSGRMVSPSRDSNLHCRPCYIPRLEVSSTDPVSLHIRL